MKRERPRLERALRRSVNSPPPELLATKLPCTAAWGEWHGFPIRGLTGIRTVNKCLQRIGDEQSAALREQVGPPLKNQHL